MRSDTTEPVFDGVNANECEAFIGRKPNTRLHLTDRGRVAFREYRRNMRQVFDNLQ